MSRAATDALWRAARRFITVLDTNLAAEVTEDAVAGVNVSAPSSGAYYLMPDARSVVEHVDNNSPRAYVYFDGDVERMARTGGPATRPVRQRFNIGVAFYILDEVGAATYADTWKTLTSREREHRRAHILIGAAEDVLESQIRDGDDVLDIQYVATMVEPPGGGDQPDMGTWVHTIWTVDQIVNVDQSFSTESAASVIPTYATPAAMTTAISNGDLSEGDVAYVTSEAENYAVSNGVAVAVSLAGGQNGLTAAQLDNLFFAHRATLDLLTDQNTAATGPNAVSQSGLTDGDQVYGMIDAASNLQIPPRVTTAGREPVWDTTPTSDATQCIYFDGSDELLFPDDDGLLDWIWADTSKTLIVRVAFLEDPTANGTQSIIGNLFGTTGGQFQLALNGSGDLVFVIKDGAGAAQNVSYTWVGAGWSVNTLYTIAVRHTGGGDTELIIDGSIVATATLTNWNSTAPAEPTAIGARGSQNTPAQMDYGGMALIQAYKTIAEIAAYDAWIQDVSG